MRLDKDLESFFQYLDNNIGKGNYTVFLTADHGAAHNPTFLKSNKIPSDFIFTKKIKKQLNEIIAKIYGDSVVKMVGENEVWLNDSITKNKVAIKELIIEQLQAMPEIEYVLDMKNLQNYILPEPLKTMLTNGYNPKRSGEIWYVVQPAIVEGYKDATGTSHGVWNPYDTHIPLLWYGFGIQKGNLYSKTAMSDISATLAALLHIQMPNGCVGNVITDVLKQ